MTKDTRSLYRQFQAAPARPPCAQSLPSPWHPYKGWVIQYPAFILDAAYFSNGGVYMTRPNGWKEGAD